MSIAQDLTVLKAELMQNWVPQVVDFLTAALEEGVPVHQVESGLCDFALRLGRQSLDAFFDAHGTGDVGETFSLPDGHAVRRLPDLHERPYVSIFGEFTLPRTG